MSIEPKVLALLIFSVSCGVVGQILFKLGMKNAGPIEFGPAVVLHFLRPLIFAGICCYALATTSWLAILSKIPLSLAYPLVSISYILVVLAGRFVLHEVVSLYTWGGVLLICLGVMLIGMGAQAAQTPPPARASARVIDGGG